MLMTGFRAAAALAVLTLTLSFAAAEDAGKLVDAVGPEISEIASGGHWSADGKGGFYRAIVVMAGDKPRQPKSICNGCRSAKASRSW
jgi:hypothetical protein